MASRTGANRAGPGRSYFGRVVTVRSHGPAGPPCCTFTRWGSAWLWMEPSDQELADMETEPLRVRLRACAAQKAPFLEKGHPVS